ncbi:MAG TPA: DedA family protein [Xanthobacteraceae bacterium]|nr:DedA family protein [Xanthobacteraceae bacterium]
MHHLLHEYGLVAVAVIVGLECLGLPVPGETALLGAAIYAGTKHDLNINGVIFTAAGAAVVGRMIGYVIGHEFGYWLLLRYGRYVELTEGRVKLGQYLFVRYGGKIIFIAQFVPVLRTLAGPFAGANLMPWRSFMFANIASSGVWAAVYGYAAYWAGSAFERLQGRIVVPLVLIAVISLIVGGLFVRQREAQLMTEAERAIPGPLELR